MEQHRADYDRIFTACGGGAAAMPQSVAVGILRGSGLPIEALKIIWELAAFRKLAELSMGEFYVAARLVAFAQTQGAASLGAHVLTALGSLQLPLAVLGAAYDQPAQSAPAAAPSSTVPIDPRARAYYSSLFRTVVGESGSISGRAAVGFFSKSGMAKDVLRHVWSLADDTACGSLNAERFEMGCRLLALAQHGGEVSVASLVTARAADSAFDMTLARFKGHDLPPSEAEPVLVTPPAVPSAVPPTAEPAAAAVAAPQIVPQVAPQVAPQLQTAPPAAVSDVAGSIAPSSDAHYGALFDELDANNGGSGLVAGGACAGFLRRSLLSKVDLRQVWALACEGEATMDKGKFVRALHLCALVQSGVDVHVATSAASILGAFPAPPLVVLEGIDAPASLVAAIAAHAAAVAVACEAAAKPAVVAAALSPYKKGDTVIYVDKRTKTEVLATVVKVHDDDPVDLYFTVALVAEGREKQTVMSRLRADDGSAFGDEKACVSASPPHRSRAFMC